MLCSTIIPTVGRSTLDRAVNSALDQDLGPETHEIIIVNDSGSPLPEAGWHKAPQLTIINTNRSERCIARNTGAAVASGKYLHFLDDDDYLLPGGLEGLLKVAESSACGWIYGAIRCLDREGEFIYDNQPQVKGNLLALLIAGEAFHLAPSLISREIFFQVNGFDPAITVLEDRDLACRLALLSDFDRTDHLIACVYVGFTNTTTDWTKRSQANRLIREKALSDPNALSRIRASVQGDVLSRGRISRAYLFSMILNLKAGHLCAALNRLYGFLSLVVFHYPLLPSFWRGLFYSSRSLKQPGDPVNSLSPT